MIFALIVAVVFLATAAGIFVYSRSGRYTRSVERTLPKNAGLSLPEWLAPSLHLRSRALMVRLCVGIVAGTGAGVIAALLVPSNDPIGFDGAIFVMAGVAVGVIVGTCHWIHIDAARRATQDAPERRPTGVRLGDILSRWSLVAVALVLVFGVLFILVCISLPATGAVADGGELTYLPRVAAYLAVALTLLGGLAFARVQLRRPQRAANPEELAWDDAMVAQAVYQFSYLGAFFAAIVSNQLGTAFMAGLSGGEETIDIRTLLLLIVFLPLPIFVAVFVAALTKPTRHYLRTLWPAVPQQ